MSGTTIIKADVARKMAEANPKDLFVLTKKKEKEGAKPTKCRYLNVSWKAVDGKLLNFALFAVENIKLVAIKDPEKKIGAEEDCKPQLAAKLSNLGDFGVFITAAQAIWPAKVDEQIALGNLQKGKKLKNLMQLTVGENSTANAGALLDDPIFRWGIGDAGETFPEGYPIKSLAGQPKTQIFDYSTGRVVNGKPVYDLATVEGPNGKRVPVDFNNIHKFVTAGSELIYGRFSITSAAGSGSYNSMQVHMSYAIIKKGVPEEIKDDLPMPVGLPVVSSGSNDNSNNAPSNTNATTATNTTPATNANNNNIPAATNDEVEEILGAL